MPNDTSRTDVTTDGPIYVSWAYQNSGNRHLVWRHHVDLYIDGIFVERWETDILETDTHRFVRDWSGVLSAINLEPGTHRARLVLDPLDEVPELREDDHLMEFDFVVTGTPAEPSVGRLPDLVPYAPEGWGGPLVVNSYLGRTEDGPLSTDVTTIIQFGFKNAGQVSALGEVEAHVYVDGIFVMGAVWPLVLADQTLALDPWPDLLETMNLKPGTHSVRVVIDPGNRIDETDESNNEYQAAFSWGTGPVPSAHLLPLPSQAMAPAPLDAPNLVPHWRFGSDGPVVVASREGTDTQQAVIVGSVAYIDVSVQNQSPVGTGPFKAALYLDGALIHEFEFPALPAGQGSTFIDWACSSPCLALQPGQHQLRVVVDSEQDVLEANEADNTFETTIEWVAEPQTEPTATSYSVDELQAALDGLAALVDDRRAVLGPEGTANADSLLAMADAGYFIMTGASFRDERITVLLLSSQEYVDWIDDEYVERFATASPQEYPDILERRESLKAEHPAFKTRWRGRVFLVVDAQRPFVEVLSALVHELGHARQDFVNPLQTEADPTHFLDAIQEAGAQQFERAYWLAVQAFLGTPLLSYPRHEAFEDVIDAQFDTWEDHYRTDEHALGYLIAWLAVLTDDALRPHRNQLIATGSAGLDVDGALAVYDRLAGLDPTSVDSYVGSLLRGLNALLPRMRELAKDRLVSGLDPQAEGSPSLLVPALMTP